MRIGVNQLRRRLARVRGKGLPMPACMSAYTPTDVCRQARTNTSCVRFSCPIISQKRKRKTAKL